MQRKSMETKFDKLSVVRQPNAQRIPNPSVLGKPTPFSDSFERESFSKTKWVPKTNVLEGLSKPATIQILPQTARQAIVQLILFIVDSGCTKHMAGNLKMLCNFVEKYLGTVRFGNDQFAPILGYEDLVQGNITINRVYYVEGLNHNLFSVGQFCDADLEVAFWKSTCFVRDLQGNDLLTGNRGSDLYTISLQETTSSTPICLMAKASPTQAWLWHRRLSHLNFDYINLLLKKDVVIGLPKLKYVKDQLCSSCELRVMLRRGIDLKNSLALGAQLGVFIFSSPLLPHKSLFQSIHLDVKTAFLNGPLKEEVYVAQPDGFVDPDHPEKVYSLRKALYGLKQAPRAWYDELSNFLMSKGFTKGTIDPTLFTIRYGEDILLVQIYVDDIIFRTSDPLIPKRGTIKMGLGYPKDSGFELTAFLDVEHAGCLATRKSTSGEIQFLGDKLVSWMSKKQDCTAMSSVKAEYVGLSVGCAQVMWMRT
ncbi:retrovirus-related pol polyprotein from transposon TNT 1-94 [Tanacetum coccineum]